MEHKDVPASPAAGTPLLIDLPPLSTIWPSGGDRSSFRHDPEVGGAFVEAGGSLSSTIRMLPLMFAGPCIAAS